MRFSAALSSITLVMMAGCTPQPTIDLEAERTTLMNADRHWAQEYASSESPEDAFVMGLTDDATLLPPDMPLAQGRDAIRAVIADLEAMPGFSVTWEPTMAEVGGGGDLGYTVGSYQMQMQGPDGPMTIDGKYLTVWQKQEDGTWLVIADMFSADGPPTSQM